MDYFLLPASGVNIRPNKNVLDKKTIHLNQLKAENYHSKNTSFYLMCLDQIEDIVHFPMTVANIRLKHKFHYYIIHIIYKNKDISL